jgi:phospholipid/cholesterol/gamma-HCH transport system substrate-binding protein
VRRALLALVALTLASCGSGREPARIDVVFDDARGLIPGQLVEIAGARVGSIRDVSVTAGYKARVHMDVDARFAPFRQDAACTIKPQGLIAENYVDCDPGTPEAPELRGDGDAPPTVPVDHTTQPVSLTDLFEVWNAPTSQRLAVLLSTLGIASAGRGEDVNGILRRANPALALARRTIRQLASERDALARTVDALTPVAAGLARRRSDLGGLLRHARRVAVRTASERGALASGIRELPPLLEQAQPALEQLGAVMRTGTPLLDRLDEAAPGVNQLTRDMPRLAAAARPTLRALAPALRRGAATARRTLPLSRLLRDYTRASLPSARTAGEMLPTLEQRGLVKSLLAFLYNTALAAARYDDHGHILPAHVGGSSCMRFATTPDPACGAPAGPARARHRPHRHPRPHRRRAAPAAPVPGPASSPTPGSRVPAVRLPPLELPPIDVPDPPDIDALLDYLLG